MKDKITDVSSKFKQMREEIDKKELLEKNKEKISNLISDMENLVFLLLNGEATNVDIMFKKDDTTLLITDRDEPVNPMDIVNRVFNERGKIYIAKFDDTKKPGPVDPEDD